MRYMIMLSALLMALSPLSVIAQGTEDMTAFERVFAETEAKKGVKEITYEQFMEIKNSGASTVILDVLDSKTYAKGHIEGAVNLPLGRITAESAKGIIPEGAGVIVYCGGFKCTASTKAALTLAEMGYKVLDYKGGLQEWEGKGNVLVK